MPRQNEGPIQIPLAVDLEARKTLTSTHYATSTELTSYIRNGFIEENKANGTQYVRTRAGYDTYEFHESTNAAILDITEVKGYAYHEATDIHFFVAEDSTSHDDLFIVSAGWTSSSTPKLLLTTNLLKRYDFTFYKNATDTYVLILGVNENANTAGGYCWIYTFSTGITIQLTNATHGFPDTEELVSGIVELDNYIFIMTTEGRVYNCNVGDPLTWTSTDFLTASSAQDEKVYIARHHDHIVTLGTSSINFYYDAGNPSGTPLALRKDLTVPMGVLTEKTGSPIGGALDFAYTYSVAQDNEHIAFIGKKHSDTIRASSIQNHAQPYGVFIIENFKIRKISTPSVDLLLGHVESNEIRIGLHVIAGRKVIFVHNTTLVYDLESGRWYWWTIDNDSTFTWVQTQGEFFIDNTGRVRRYLVDSMKDSTDYVTPVVEYPFTIRTPQTTLGSSNNKFCTSTTLIGDYTSGIEYVEVSWTDNNYQNFSTARDYDLRKYNKLTRCGMFRKRAWKIHRDSSTTEDDDIIRDIRLSHIEIDVKGAVVNTAD